MFRLESYNHSNIVNCMLVVRWLVHITNDHDLVTLGNRMNGERMPTD